MSCSVGFPRLDCHFEQRFFGLGLGAAERGTAGAGLRLQDASLYHGKYYLYYGPTPAVTLFLPWRIISGRDIPQSLAVLLYTSAGWGFSCLLLCGPGRSELCPTI